MVGGGVVAEAQFAHGGFLGNAEGAAAVLHCSGDLRNGTPMQKRYDKIPRKLIFAGKIYWV